VLVHNGGGSGEHGALLPRRTRLLGSVCRPTVIT